MAPGRQRLKGKKKSKGKKTLLYFFIYEYFFIFHRVGASLPRPTTEHYIGEAPLRNKVIAHLSCAKNHDIERRRAVVKLPRAREKEREEDTVCNVVHIIFSRDVISEIHTRETSVSYVTMVACG